MRRVGFLLFLLLVLSEACATKPESTSSTFNSSSIPAPAPFYSNSRTPPPNAQPTAESPVTYPDRSLVLSITKYCSNSESEVNSIIDQTVASIQKFTGRPTTREYVIAQSLDIIDGARHDKKYPRNRDGKLEFGAIAAGVQLWTVEHPQ